MAASSRARTLFGESLRSLFRGRGKSHAKSRAISRRPKLGLESLEGRLVLTTFTVNTFNDTPAAIVTGPFAGRLGPFQSHGHGMQLDSG